MTKSTLNQFDYTESFLRAAGIPEDQAHVYHLSFWWNCTNQSNLRLSTKGINFLKKETKIPIYSIKISSDISSKDLIRLSRVCFCPYYLEQYKTIWLLGEEEATMLALHAGNLSQYLANLTGT